MPLILGIVLLLTLGTTLLVQNTFQQFPIVTKDVIQHEAYRAMVAGVDEYLYKINANPNYAACTTNFYNGSGTFLGSGLSGSASICSGLAFGSWIQVPGSGSSNGPPAWFLLSNPSINTSTGNLSINVVGFAGYPNTFNYQTAVITLQPLNSFLLNVLWINYNQIDPPVVSQYFGVPTPTCPYYWQNGDNLGNNCRNVDFISADSLTGNLYVNDTIWVCGSPTFKTVQTADTQQAYVQDCSGHPSSTSWTNPVPIEPIPTDNSGLATQAAANGCLYEGPTTITLTGTTMKVTSPDTPTGKPAGAPGGSLSNDALNNAANTANVCMPSSSGGSVTLPADGVVYVENCPNSAQCNSTNYNPMAGEGETGVGGPTVGDAIVQGSYSSPLTIGAANNIIIDGNLCTTDTVSGSPSSCPTGPAAPSTDVLGLVALNYIEINHPVDGNGNNVSTCPAGLGNGSPSCDLQNPIVDAVSLTLNHSFIVNNYNTGNPLGTLTMNGTIDEDWRGPVGTSSGGSIQTGYAKNYQYDARLKYLSPPYYLNPGTSQWGFASFTVAAGQCKMPTGQTCPVGYP